MILQIIYVIISVVCLAVGFRSFATITQHDGNIWLGSALLSFLILIMIVQTQLLWIRFITK